MSDLQHYIEARAAHDSEFSDGFEEGYTNFKIGVLLRQARETAGLTRADVAQRLQTPESAISKIENHAEDVRLSLLKQYAAVLGKKLQITPA